MKRLAFIILTSMLVASCSGIPLKVEELQRLPGNQGATFTLIYFVGTGRYDVRRAVILDLEDDIYEFKPIVEDFEFEILQNITVPEAIYEAELFFRHQGVKGYSSSAIILPGGNLAGYELRPLYNKKFMGVEDLLKMSYNLNSKTAIIGIDISLRASLKRLVY